MRANSLRFLLAASGLVWLIWAGSVTCPTCSGAADGPSVTLQPQSWDELQASLKEHAGKVVVIDFWSTSCEPCLREMPHLVALQEKHGQSVVGISVNCDYIGLKKKPPEFYRERVTKTLTDLKAQNLVNVLCTLPSDDLFAALKIDSIPAVFVYGRDGKLAHRFDNRTSKGEDGISYEKQITPAVTVLLK